MALLKTKELRITNLIENIHEENRYLTCRRVYTPVGPLGGCSNLKSIL